MGIGNFVSGLAGSALSRAFSSRDADRANRLSGEAFAQNVNLQKEFAKHGLQWRVEDAQRSGVHPLYALGASLPAYSPSGMSVMTPDSDFRSMGQNVARARYATSAPRRRVQSRLEALQLERAELENNLLASQIRQLEQPGTPPAVPFSDEEYVPLPRQRPFEPERMPSELITPGGTRVKLPRRSNTIDAWTQVGGEPMEWLMLPSFLAALAKENFPAIRRGLSRFDRRLGRRVRRPFMESERR